MKQAFLKACIPKLSPQNQWLCWRGQPRIADRVLMLVRPLERPLNQKWQNHCAFDSIH